MAKEQPPMPPASLPPGHPDVSEASTPGLQYQRPAGWQEVPAGQMRVASFRVAGKEGKQADVSVIPLPGLAGSDLDNVNRWRGQVGLTGVSEEELAKLVQPVEIAGQPAKLYEQAGTMAGSGEKTRILAAITRRDGVAWFFKMTGDDDLVAEQKPAFVEFLKSVSFPAGARQAQLPSGRPPVGAGGMNMMMGQAGTIKTTTQAKPNWEAPSGWKEVPGGQFLVAKFIVVGRDDAEAAVNVSVSPGDGGGLRANVDRWRGQLGLAPTGETDLAKQTTSLDLAGGRAVVADLTGKDARTGQEARLLAVVVPRPGQTWFYKLMGNTQVVEGQKEAFLKFVQGVKY